MKDQYALVGKYGITVRRFPDELSLVRFAMAYEGEKLDVYRVDKYGHEHYMAPFENFLPR